MRYLLKDCHESLDTAIAAMEKIIKDELRFEQKKFNDVRGRLRSAIRAAKKLSVYE